MGCRPPPESGGQPVTARYLAVKALMRQEQNGYANLVLDSELKACKPPLSPRDAAFASGIFYTVLERRSLLDYLQKKDINRYRALIAELGLRK